MDPSRKVPLCPKKTRQNDPRDEMIDEKSFSCPFFCHSFLFQWDLLFFFFVLGEDNSNSVQMVLQWLFYCQHDSTC